MTHKPNNKPNKKEGERDMKKKTLAPALQKKLSDSHGDILVRVTPEYFEASEKRDDLIVAEIVTQGCVIAFYRARFVDKTYWEAELSEVSDRLTSVEIDTESLKDALYWGRRIANTVIDFYFN